MKEYKLYYLGGQSNMDGHGFNGDLPAFLKKPMKNVKIFCGNPAPDMNPTGGLGIWDDLRPGFGKDFHSDGKRNYYSDYFGPELSFAAELLKENPEENIAIIKYSHGGTSLALNGAKDFGTWYPDYNIGNRLDQYDHFLATLRNAFAIDEIDGEKIKLIPTGIIWHQGESDAVQTKEIALEYKKNLKRLMDLMRAAFRVRDLPIVIVAISDSGIRYGKQPAMNYGDIVLSAQEEFVKDDYFAALVKSTHNYDFADEWHYKSEGYIDLGRECARAIIQLQRIQNRRN